MKRNLTLFLLGVALAWPPLHMVASRYFGYSPWRFFGWGMYAVPHPEAFTTVRIIFREGTEPRECVKSQKPIHPRLQIFVAANGSFKALSPCGNNVRSAALVQRVLHFRDETAMSDLLFEIGPARPGLVLLTDQRISLSGGSLYTLTTSYTCSESGCGRSEEFDSRTQDVKQLLFSH